MVLGQRRSAIGALLACVFAAFGTTGVSGQESPAILVGQSPAVHPGQTATITIQVLDAPGERAQLTVAAELAPEWLAPAAWRSGPALNPRLEISLSPPADAVPGTYQLAIHATNDSGFTTATTAFWRVLPPICAGAVEYDDEGICRECPPNHVPNAAKTDCVPCPQGAQRLAAEAFCTDCPAGQTSRAGESCRCGGAARLTDDGCVACPSHADSVRNARNCDACPPSQHRPEDADSCRPCPTGGTGAACTAAASAKGATTVAANAEARPTLTLTVSPTELTESTAGQEVTVAATLSVPAPAGTAFALTFACATCYADYAMSGLRRIVVPEGSTSASTTLTFLVANDLPVDDGKVIEVGAAITGYDITKAKITLREPASPTIVVSVADTGRLSAGTQCGEAGRLCVLETAGQVRLNLEIQHPPDFAYRQCSVALASSGPNTATAAAAGSINDYQLLQASGGVRLGPGTWSTDAWLVPEYDGEVEGPEALTLRGACAGGINNQHYNLRWASTTIWIGDVPWPTLTVERPANGHVAGDGIDCGSGTRDDCTHAAQRNATVTLTATADAHHRFAGWGGACSGTGPCTVLLDADKTATAAFAATSHPLTVERAADGYVTGSGIDCGSGTRTDCDERHAPSATVTLRATADANHRLLRWSGACSGTGPECRVTMDAAKTAAAVFGAEQRWLWVSPPRGGKITGPGIDCGDGAGDCVKTYDHGTEVVLRAVASENSVLDSWSGPCEDGSETCTVTMDKNTTAGASFTPVRRTLTVARPTNGYVEAKGIDCGSGTRDDCTTTGNHGSALALRATADDGYAFDSWTGACTSKAPKCSLTLDGDLSAGATFLPKRTLTLTPPTNGYVSGPGISCGVDNRADCTESYKHGTAVTLTPTAATGHDFEKWGGACLDAPTACRLDMTADQAVTARFEAQRRTLSVSVTGTGTVAGNERLSCASGTCSRDYAYGTSVTLTATPGTGYDFDKWSGACSGTSETCTVEMTAAASATATFKPEKRTLRVTVKGTGTVTDLSGVKCSSGTCTWTYDYGTVVSLSADGGTGHDFQRWDGECARAGTTCSFTVTVDGATTANFQQRTYELELNISGDGAVAGKTPAGRRTFRCESGRCPYRFAPDKVLDLEAQPGENSEFCYWKGACGSMETCGGATTCPGLKMDQDRSIIAKFVLKKRTLSLMVEGKGEARARGIGVCTKGPCTAEYDHGARVGINTFAATGYDFDEWLGACASETGDSCTVEMTADFGTTAKFKPEKRTLTVTIAGTGTGRVTGTGGFTCSRGTCKRNYDYDKTVELTATPGTGQLFDKWTGACKGSSPTCTIKMTDALSTTATFKPDKRTLTVTIAGKGTVTGTDGFTCSKDTCTKDYDYGTPVELTATRGTGQLFDKWTGACKGSSPTCKVKMTHDRSTTATFKPDKRTLSVTIAGKGTVTGTGGFTCSKNTCRKDYDYGESVDLTATRGTGHTFYQWTGACKGSSPTCTVKMTHARNTTATFKPDKRLSVTIVGSGRVTGTGDFTCSTGTCTKDYHYGTSVTLTATRGTGHTFDKWTGACTGSSRTCTVEMTAARSTTATFKPEKRTLSVTITGDGRVTGTGRFTCTSGTCTQDYDYGKEVELTATLNLTHNLAWTGCDSTTGGKCKVAMTSNKTVTLAYTLRCPTDCTTSTCGGKEVCKCAGASCPSNYTRHGSCVATAARTCTGDTDGCGRSVRDTRCTTGSRTALANRAPETCLYEHRDRNFFSCRHSQRTCRASITHVGCLPSLGGPINPPLDFQDEEVWSEAAHGHIVPIFECGTKANTCTVTFEDETVTTEDYGVVDKDDTDEERRWECHSDNGTVRQCSLPTGDG